MEFQDSYFKEHFRKTVNSTFSVDELEYDCNKGKCNELFALFWFFQKLGDKTTYIRCYLERFWVRITIKVQEIFKETFWVTDHFSKIIFLNQKKLLYENSVIWVLVIQKVVILAKSLSSSAIFDRSFGVAGKTMSFIQANLKSRIFE